MPVGRSLKYAALGAMAGALWLIPAAPRFLEVQPASRPAQAASSPGARLGHALSYVDDSGLVMLFGGFLSDGLPRADLWAWDGRAWRLVPGPGPAARRWPAMTYDQRRRRLLMHGGRDGVGAQGRQLDDTWQWDSTGWRLLARSGPGGRDHHRMTYDGRRDRVVLFGGWDGDSTRSDTWELEGDQWRLVARGGPAARAAHGLTYDPQRDRTVLFGGSSDTVFFGDTWLWDGQAWSAVAGPAPPSRSFHGMAFDHGRGVVVAAGGRRGTMLYADTWGFDGTRWRIVRDTTLPARYVYDLAYDRRNAELVFHGGGFMRDGRWALFAETWAWRAGGWREAARE
ncbi:MAG TPA: kelch repeat-containing protein [Gemmatimonadaceae bacterium]|nr:kelch repeat-containing protein [Gemmatimonadaceae bacterium]